MKVWSEVAAFLRRDGVGALVTLETVAGSAPREAGARMVVRADGAFRGTIGGGALEWQVLAEVQSLLRSGAPVAKVMRQALGPDLGQCCGGHVSVRIEIFDADDLVWIAPLVDEEARSPVLHVTTDATSGRRRRLIATAHDATETYGDAATPVLLFGAGHVGRALVLALAPLPFEVVWIDPRPDAFPEVVPLAARCLRSSAPVEALQAFGTGALVVVMTHSHALDLAIIAAALKSPQFPYVGLIGSATKRARFETMLRQGGLGDHEIARLVCPVGAGTVRDKSPAVIAAMVAAELLAARERLSAAAASCGAQTS